LQNYPEATIEIPETGGVLLTFARTEASQPEESGATAQQSAKISPLVLNNSGMKSTATCKKI